MKKKLITIALAALMAVGAMFALSACKPPQENNPAVATYGAVANAKENYGCFYYATVKVDKDGKTSEVEIGEAFGPAGKVYINNAGTVTYLYPLYGSLNDIITEAGTGDLESKQNAIKDKYFFSIAGEKFVLSVKKQMLEKQNGDPSAEEETLVFVSTADASKVLTNAYLAANMKWYVDAAKAGTVFACDSDGVKLADWAPANGAVLKNDLASTYQNNRGLSGPGFKKAMEELAAFAIEKDCVIEYETAESGGNWENKWIKDFAFSKPQKSDGTDITTGATASATDFSKNFLQYQASYIECAVQAKALAVAAQTQK